MTQKKTHAPSITWTGKVDLSASEDTVEEGFAVVMGGINLFREKFDDLMTQCTIRGITSGTIRVTLQAVFEEQGIPSKKSTTKEPRAPSKKRGK